MKQIELIMVGGLPGSGKTHWCEKYVKEHKDIYWMDDASIDQDFLDKIDYNVNIFGYRNLLISDPYLVSPIYRQALVNTLVKIPDVEIVSSELYYFSNEPTQCLTNVLQRNDGRLVKGLILQLSKEFGINNIAPFGVEDRVMKLHALEVYK